MKKYFLVFAALMAMSAPSFAAVAFVDLDTDKDDFISMEEAKMDESVTSAFVVLDVDEDGLISSEEFLEFEQDE